MNFNFSSFLSGSLRILNIANKTLPLIKEASPTISNLRKRYHSFKRPVQKSYLKELDYQEKQKKEIVQNSNLPTFFK